jgi:hypothetical protein
MRSITRYLETTLELEVNPTKSKVAPMSECRASMESAAKGEPVEKPSSGRLLACERRMARTPALQQALSNAWLKAQGLVSVKHLWCKAQGYVD